MDVKLYVWKSPRVSEPDAAAELVRTWQEASGSSEGREGHPFEASNDVHWFYNELVKDAPGIESTVDAEHEHGKERWWWAADPGPTDRLVALTSPAATPEDVVSDIFAIAAKYDLVVYDPQRGIVHLPLEAMTAYASATFWPSGAVQAFVAGLAGGAIAVVAWFLAIPILSGLAILVGGFMFVMAVFTFIHEGRKAIRERGRPTA